MSKTENTSQGFMLNELPDEKILSEEISLMATLLTGKERIIRQAAKKLDKSGKYSDDVSVICSRLKKLWGKHISNSTINGALEGKEYEIYKRPYEKKSPETPETLLEEILFRFQDQNKQMDKILTSVIKKVKQDPKTQQIVEQALVNSIHELHTNPSGFIIDSLSSRISKIGDLKSLLKFIKSEQVNIDHLEKMVDWRQRLDEFMKVRIRMIFFTEHLAKIGNDMHYSAKWISAITRDDSIPNIEKDSEFKATQLLINTYRNCPACNWDMADWFNKAHIAEQQGVEIPMPESRKLKCIDCKNSIS